VERWGAGGRAYARPWWGGCRPDAVPTRCKKQAAPQPAARRTERSRPACLCSRWGATGRDRRTGAGKSEATARNGTIAQTALSLARPWPLISRTDAAASSASAPSGALAGFIAASLMMDGVFIAYHVAYDPDANDGQNYNGAEHASYVRTRGSFTTHGTLCCAFAAPGSGARCTALPNPPSVLLGPFLMQRVLSDLPPGRAGRALHPPHDVGGRKGCLAQAAERLLRMQQACQ
jgi:hypothetical protein